MANRFFTPLPDGGTIAVVAPSSRVTVEALMPAVAWFETRGYNVRIHPQCEASHHQSAGTIATRAAALNDVLADPNIHAVIAAAGGNRAGTLLTRIDYDAVSPAKPVLGFSDTTFLLNALHARTGLITLHGPTFRTLAKGRVPDEHFNQMLAAMRGKPGRLTFRNAAVSKRGKAQGPLVGGNLSVFASLLGTPYMPDVDGAILFLEDTGDETSRYDRMLTQLKLAGVFDRIGGLVIGALDEAADTGSTPFGYSLGDILADHLHQQDYPVLTGAPFGHGDALYTFPIGGEAVLDLDGPVPVLDMKPLG